MATTSTPQPSVTPPAVAEEQRTPISLGRESGGILVLLIFIAALILLTSEFLTLTNLDNLVRQVTVFAILSIGELFVILTGGIDLSVGSVLGLSGGVTALLLVGGAPIPLAILVGRLLLLTGAKTIAPLPDAFNAIANGFVLGLPSLFWILIIVTVVAAFVLGRTVFGRYVY